jgi:30S ribosomal protein S31
MGKGDRRTKRGKIFRGSYGNARPKKKRRKSEAAKRAKAENQ